LSINVLLSFQLELEDTWRVAAENQNAVLLHELAMVGDTALPLLRLETLPLFRCCDWASPHSHLIKSFWLIAFVCIMSVGQVLVD